MEDKKKYIETIFILVLVIVVFVICISLVFKKSKVYNQNLNDFQKENVGQNENTSKLFNLKRIIYSKGEKLYSSDLDGNDEKNLTDILGLQKYQKIKANKNISKIGYVTRTDSDLSVWVADSDGSNSKLVFSTNSSGCNAIGIIDVNEDGSAIIFNYITHNDGEIGSCVEKTSPQMVVDGIFYRKVYDKNGSERLLDQSGYGQIVTHIIGFSGKDILWSVTQNGSILSAWLMNTDIWQSKELFSKNFEGYLGEYSYLSAFFDSGSNYAVFQNGSKIEVFDYKNNTTDLVASGSFAGYQGVRPSPNLERFIYENDIHLDGGDVTREFFIYDIKDKKSTPIDLGQGHSLVLWKDDNSFYYRSPLVGSFPPSDMGEVRLFDVKTFNSKKVFGPVSEIIGSGFRSL